MAIIEVSKLTKYYGRYMSIEDITFSVAKGEIFGLLGDEDAGKTTILDILSGKVKPNSGTAIVAGLNCQTDADQISKMIRVVSENGDNSVKIKAKTVGKLLEGIQADKARVRAKRWCDEFQLDETDTIRKLSKEKKIALYIINALVDMPRVLAVDDPFDGTSAEFTEHLSVFLKRENKRGLTVILTSREQRFLNRVCTNIATVHEGRLLPMQVPDQHDELDDFAFGGFDDSRMYGSFSGKPFEDLPAQGQPKAPENRESRDPFADLFTDHGEEPEEVPETENASETVDDSDLDIDSMWTMPSREKRAEQFTENEKEPVDLDDEFNKLFLEDASGVWGSSASIFTSAQPQEPVIEDIPDIEPPRTNFWQSANGSRTQENDDYFDDMFLADEHNAPPRKEEAPEPETPALAGNGNRRFVLHADDIPVMYLKNLGVTMLQSADDFAEFIYNGPIDNVLLALSQMHVNDLQITIDPPDTAY